MQPPDLRGRCQPQNCCTHSAAYRHQADASKLQRQQQLLDLLLSQPDLVAKLQAECNNNGATPLAVAATWGQRDVFDRLLAEATADVLESTTRAGEPLTKVAHLSHGPLASAEICAAQAES